MDTSLYDDDILTWSEQQAAALRDLAANHPEISNAIDWENLIEEVESLGRSDLQAVESQLRNALTHILKGYCDTGSLSLQAWSIETDVFLTQARELYRNSMRQRIDADDLWRRAFSAASKELIRYKRRISPNVPSESPFKLAEMLDETFDFESAVRRLYDLYTEPMDPRSPKP